MEVNAARQLTKLFFGILAAFKESMTLHLAHTQTDRQLGVATGNTTRFVKSHAEK